MNYSLKLNTAPIRALVNSAFSETADDLAEGFDRVIEADIWSWPVSPSPRDIVDTTALLKSRTVTEKTLNSVKWEWTVFYSIYVLLGTSKMQGRDWIAKGIEDTRPYEKFSDLVRAGL